MILRQASAERLEVMRRTSMKAPWFIAFALALIAMLPLLSGGTPTLARIVASALLLFASASLFAFSRPREQLTSLDLREKTITSKRGKISLERARYYALQGAGHSPADEAARNRYRVDLVLDDGRPIPLLERADPARVLGDLRAALRYLPLPVKGGWGLPSAAEPWKGDRPIVPAADREVEAHGRPMPSETGAGICALGGTLVIGTVIVLAHMARIENNRPTSGLSDALNATLLFLLVSITTFLLTDRISVVRRGAALLVERRAFGFRLGNKSIALDGFRGAFAVGPTEIPLHVLIDLGDNLVAIPMVGEPAHALVRALGSGD